MNPKSTWIERVKKNWKDLSRAPSQLRDDEDVVFAAVKNNWGAFRYASPLLQNDKKFFMEKLIPLSYHSPYALKYASGELQKDKEVVKKAVHYNYLSLSFANSKLKYDRDFVKELVQLKGIAGYPPAYALRYASKRVQHDKEVVLAAVKNYGGALEYASDELRNDREFCLECVKIDKDAFRYVSEELKDDKEVVREAARKSGWSFEYASEELRNDREFCLECVKIDKDAFRYVSEELRKEFGKTKEEFMKRKRKEGSKMEVKIEKKKKGSKKKPKQIKLKPYLPKNAPKDKKLFNWLSSFGYQKFYDKIVRLGIEFDELEWVEEKNVRKVFPQAFKLKKFMKHLNILKEKSKKPQMEKVVYSLNKRPKYAFLVGQPMKNSGIELSGTENDIDLMKTKLSELGYLTKNMKIVRSKSHKKVKSQLLGFLEDVPEKANFVFYYSGHGIQKEGKVNLLCEGVGAKKATYLSVEYVYTRINDLLESCHVFILLDCCQNDPTKEPKGTKSGEKKIPKAFMISLSELNAENQIVMEYSCMPGNYSVEEKFGEKTYSVFTKFFSMNMSSEQSIFKVHCATQKSMKTSTSKRVREVHQRVKFEACNVHEEMFL